MKFTIDTLEPTDAAKTAKRGCFVDAKARFRSQGCPLRKWPAV